MRPLLFCASLYVVLNLNHTAKAAGSWNLERGVAAYGRGGAYIASPDDNTALYTNPAALADLPGLQFIFERSLVLDHRRFARARDTIDGKDYTYEPVGNEWSGFPGSGGVFLSYNFKKLGLDNLTLAAALYGRPRVDTIWPETGAQRYSTIEAHHKLAQWSLGAGYALPWLDMHVGGALILYNPVVNSRIALSLLGEDTDFDVVTSVKAKKNWLPGGLFAWSIAPIQSLRIAATYQLPLNIRAQGNVKFEQNGRPLNEVTGSFLQVAGDKITSVTKMPGVGRLAVLYQPAGARYEIETALVYEGWSRVESLRYELSELEITSFGKRIELDEIILNQNWRDSYSIRLGGHFESLPEKFLIRAGSYYERSAVPLQRMTAASFDLDKIGVTTGTKVVVSSNIWIDAAAGYVYLFTRDIKNSTQQLFDPLTNTFTHPIANGRYTNHQYILQLGIGTQFDL